MTPIPALGTATEAVSAPGLEAYLGAPADMVSRICPPGCLVPEAALRRAEGIAEAMPPAFDGFGFEAHLGRSVADFALRLDPGTLAARALENAFAPGGSLHASPPSPGWNALRDTVRELRPGSPLLRDGLAALWVTFERPEAPPEPALHACLDAGLVLRGETEPLDEEGGQRARSALSRIRELWHPADPGGAASDSLRDLAAWLTGRGRLAHVSFAPGRGAEAWKASLWIRKGAFPDFLRKSGWVGDRAMAARVLDRFCPLEEGLRTGLTAGAGRERRIGIELFSGASNDDDGASRAEALERMAEAGLCTPEERNALRAWDGVRLESDPGSGRLFLAARKWYAKLILDADGGFSAKAYLTWIPAAPGMAC